jgi:hypothetical protein
MKPRFALVTQGSEANFLGCKECIPDDEQILAFEIANERNLEPDDVRVNYALKNGVRQVSVFLRKIREINCHKDPSWIVDAKKCLKEKVEFDLIQPTEADVIRFDSVAKTYADVFQCSNLSKSTFRRTFRLIQ